MLGRIGLLAIAALVVSGGSAVAKTLEEAVVNCHRLSGIPLGGILSPQADHRVALVTNPDWLKRPTGDDVQRAYPAHAREYGLNGQTIISCRVGTDTQLHDCAVKTEAPAGRGFGAAALQLAGLMRMVPKLVDCEPVDGAMVTIPINFGAP